MGFKPEKFNHISAYGEALLCDFLRASPRRPSDHSAVDIVLHNGQTAQVKTTNASRKDITCTYVGDEPVDLIFVIEIDVMQKTAGILYGGSFSQFIAAINKETKSMGWDNHRCPQKSLVRHLQEQFGALDYTMLQRTEF
jgi:hypothetical protein